MTDNLLDVLTKGAGYITVQKLFSPDLVNSIVKRLPEIYPVRASTLAKEYAEGEAVKSLTNISVWWSQQVKDWIEVVTMQQTIGEMVKRAQPNLAWHSSDIVVIEPKVNWINPHVDTPHRFKKWNNDPRLLGVQCIVTLQDTDLYNGSTGLVPGSQMYDWDIDKCYSGEFNQYFNVHSIQTNLPSGSLLLYNARILHSSMPNKSPKPRHALLFNYVDQSIVEEISEVDSSIRV